MLRSAFIALVLLTVNSACHAANSKKFDADPVHVFNAAIRSIEARGIVLSSKQGDWEIKFISGTSEGSLKVIPGVSSAEVVVESHRVQAAGVTGHDLMWGSRGSDKQILNGIADALAGKELKPNRRLQEESRNIAGKLHDPGVSAPASVTIRGSIEAVKSALVAECARKGMAMKSESDHQITFFKDAAAGINLASELLFGDYNIRAYQANVQFMLASQSGSVAVTAAAELLSQNGYGAVSRTIVSEDPQARASLQSILDAAKARVEGGAK